VQNVRAMSAVPGTFDVVVAGDGANGSYLALVTMSDPAKLRWFKDVPAVTVVMSLAIDPARRRIVLAGTFDRLVGFDYDGGKQLELVGVQRPLALGLTFLGDEWFAATSLWGGLSFWRTTGERLEPSYDSWLGQGPVRLAFSRSRQRLYAADGDGGVIELTFGLRDLLDTACRRLDARTAGEPSRITAGLTACRASLAKTVRPTSER
jgi:hypothetical protein